MTQDNATPTIGRNATLDDLAAMIRHQHARKFDFVAPISTLSVQDGMLVVQGAEAQITEDGVDTIDGAYQMTRICDDGFASRLDIPVGYLARCRAANIPVLDANLNGWLRHEINAGRKYLVRTFRGEGDGPGIARAFLSDSYRPIDHLDALMAALSGIKNAGVSVSIDSCDLTETRMSVRVACEELRALAPNLLRNYRSPFDGGVERAGGWTLERARRVAARENLAHEPGAEPVVFAGFEFNNSETGHGHLSFSARLVIEACRNGLKIPVQVFKTQHLGAKLDEGVFRWGDETRRRNLELITAQASDAVTTYLSQDFLNEWVGKVEALAGAPVEQPEETIKVVSTKLAFPKEVQDDILSHFILGGLMTAGGLANAITSVAQTVGDADLAYVLENNAYKAMELVAG